jgi:hypothetical protein
MFLCSFQLAAIKFIVMKKLAATILLMGAVFTGAFAQTSQKTKTTTTTPPATHHTTASSSTVKKDETKHTAPANSEAVAVKHKHKHHSTSTTKKEGTK